MENLWNQINENFDSRSGGGGGGGGVGNLLGFQILIQLISYTWFLECTLNGDYLSLVHTGSWGNRSHEIPGIKMASENYYNFFLSLFSLFIYAFLPLHYKFSYTGKGGLGPKDFCSFS